MQERAQLVRSHTVNRLAALGFPAPPQHLPVLANDEDPFVVRPVEQVVDRALVVNVRINLAFGMPADRARGWLASNRLTGCVTRHESEIMTAVAREDEREKSQVEALWALAWALGLVPALDHRAYCGDHLATLVPDLRAGESAHAWRSRVEPRLRSVDEIWSELDLLYAMTWAVAEANLAAARVPGIVDQYVFWERRRALEFLRAEQDEGGHRDWDTVDLST